MDVLVNKQYKQYDKFSRYSPLPYYFNVEDDKYVYGTYHQLDDGTNYQIYVTKHNDTYDSIALQFYNNPTYYWIIVDFNRINDPFVPPKEGTRLKIPAFSNLKFED